jgi:hypothetical protein
MSVLEQLDLLIETSRQLGYRVRYDYFGGTGGGFCQFNGGKWLFIDLALSAHEQVEHLHRELAGEPGLIDPVEKLMPRVA